MPKSTKSVGDYEIGYRKPPKATQFPKGQSGNPKGRPRKPQTVHEIVRLALNSKVRVRDGDQVRQITQFKAVVLKQLELAMKGDQKAADLVVRVAASFAGQAANTEHDGLDGTELTQEQQKEVLAEILKLHGVNETGTEKGVEGDAKP